MDIGIIGGSDGPTTIFVVSGAIQYIIGALIFVGIVVVGLIALKKRKDSAKK